MSTTAYAVSEGQRFAHDHDLTVVECYSCKMPYAIPTSLYKSAQKYPGDCDTGWKVHCPMGHVWWYTGESPEDKLRQVQERLERERARAGRLAAERDQAQASARAQRGAATRARNERDRIKRRAANGVCPCCGRTFKQVARHMRSQHPDYVVDANAVQ